MLKKKIIIFYIALLTFILDRLSKLYILKLTEIENNTNFQITSFLDLNLVFNKGIAFGLLSFDQIVSYNIVTIVIIIITVIILVMALNSTVIEKIGFSLIFGGSLGNIFDRIYYRAVIDFIDININNIHWFIFNFADIFISTGVIILIFYEIFKKKYE